MENENKILTLANLTGKIALQSGVRLIELRILSLEYANITVLMLNVLYLSLVSLPLLEITKVRFSALLKEFNQELQI